MASYIEGAQKKERQEKEARVHFVCQKCHQPLRLDPSFYQADAQTIEELTAPLLSSSSQNETEGSTALGPHHPDETFSNNEELPSPDGAAGVTVTTIPKIRRFVSHLSTESGNGFAVLNGSSDSSGNGDTMLSHRHRVLAELFDVVSGQSEVDHPLCEECTDTLLDSLDQQLRITEDECKEYKDFLAQLKDSTAEEENLQELQQQLEKVSQEKREVEAALAELEDSERAVQKSIEEEQETVNRLTEEEKRYWRDYAEYNREYFEYEDEHRSVVNQLKYAETQLGKLKKTNIFNATFHIWYSGHFGTINGFRLGRLPNVPVEWSEINAAWGQTVLLLYSLARKMNMSFLRYRLVPFGNRSYVESLADKKELPLYSSGGFKFFWDTRFDQAMVAFLDCLQQFKEEIEKGDSNFCLPFRMEKGKIEEVIGNNVTWYSIKTQINSEEQWTKALKSMLTNLKWGITWASSQSV